MGVTYSLVLMIYIGILKMKSRGGLTTKVFSGGNIGQGHKQWGEIVPLARREMTPACSGRA